MKPTSNELSDEYRCLITSLDLLYKFPFLESVIKTLPKTRVLNVGGNFPHVTLQDMTIEMTLRFKDGSHLVLVYWDGAHPGIALRIKGYSINIPKHYVEEFLDFLEENKNMPCETCIHRFKKILVGECTRFTRVEEKKQN